MAKIPEKIKWLLNWKFLLTYGVAWAILHGWSFVFVIVGSILKIEWMFISGSFWVGILVMPNGVGVFTTLALAIPLQKWWFSKDEKLQKELERLKPKKKTKKLTELER